MSEQAVGIAALGVHFPAQYLDLSELARLRQVDPDKYRVGLGCEKMAICLPDYTVVDLAVTAAKRALMHWGKDPAQIGLLVVGTESATDMSRPMSAWIAEKLQLKGALRSYEVKHACYGGTLALRQAVEWKLSGNATHKAALVIAADIAQYAVNDPGEPTQGAGAVAMVIDEPRIASIDKISYPWSEPVFDFWHPIDTPYPLVEGQFSLACYQRAAVNCFTQWTLDHSAEALFHDFAACCFHVPFPKMVKKAVVAVGEAFGWKPEKILQFYRQKVEHTMQWNQQCGNAYTASLWIAVACALSQLNPNDQLSAFSYGSGFGAELLTLTAGEKIQEKAWVNDVEKDFCQRQAITGEDYHNRRIQA